MTHEHQLGLGLGYLLRFMKVFSRSKLQQAQMGWGGLLGRPTLVERLTLNLRVYLRLVPQKYLLASKQMELVSYRLHLRYLRLGGLRLGSLTGYRLRRLGPRNTTQHSLFRIP